MFLMGVAAALNPCVGYVYIMEIAEKKHETLVITLSQIGEGIPTLIGPLYFMFVGTSWKPLVIMGTFVSLMSTILVFWVIESPRYLYSIGDHKACTKAI
jgi:MFS family permease